MEKRPNRLFIQGKCDETLTQLCRDVGWMKEFIAVNPERMKKAGITLEEEKKEEKEEVKEDEEKKEIEPKSESPAKE